MGNGNTGSFRGQGGGGQGSGQAHGNGGQGNAYAYGQDKAHGQSGSDHGNSNNAAGGSNGNGQDHGNASNPLALEGEGRGEGGSAHASVDTGTNLPGNSDAGLENALANGEGNKYGIYKHLDRMGDTADANGEIVSSGAATGGTGATQAQKFLYYYHPDHLGSTGYVTDANGKLYEHIEYFPFGETWVQEHSNTLRTPYLFTGKELDQETGLYYFGARYYDPRTSVWQSADPILEKFLPHIEGGHQKDGDAGGVFNTRNLGMYSYSYNNPIKLSDPDGRCPICIYVLVVYADEILAGTIITAEIAGGASVTSGGPSAAKAVVQEARAAVNAERAAAPVVQHLVQANRAAGKLGEAATRANLGEKIAGEQVTFATSTGERTVADFVTKIGEKLGIVETKTGNAILSAGQKQLKQDIENGVAVIPVGKNAEKAGLKPGKPVTFPKDAHTVDHQ
jgi:RHS repeat-associated protein